VNENNTNGGPGNEAKGPRPLDFNGTEIRPGLWAIEDDELQRIGNAAYQAGRGEREGEVAQLREALELASQQQAKIAAVLGLEPGEDVLAEVQGVAEILRKSCAALGIYAEHAADLPSEIGSLRSLSSLRDDVVKALGFGAVDNFSLFFGRAINAEVDDATRRIDAARLRAVANVRMVSGFVVANRVRWTCPMTDSYLATINATSKTKLSGSWANRRFAMTWQARSTTVLQATMAAFLLEYRTGSFGKSGFMPGHLGYVKCSACRANIADAFGGHPLVMSSMTWSRIVTPLASCSSK
jgi:hypothetical protein